MSKLSKTIPIHKNLNSGDCALWFNVIAITKRGFVNHVCAFDVVKTFEEAILYYYKTYYKVGDVILRIQYHKYSFEELTNLSKAC